MAKVQTQLLLDPPVWGRLNVVAAAAGIVRAEAARRAIEGQGLRAMEQKLWKEIETLRTAAFKWKISPESLAHRMLTDKILIGDVEDAKTYSRAHAASQKRRTASRRERPAESERANEEAGEGAVAVEEMTEVPA